MLWEMSSSRHQWTVNRSCRLSSTSEHPLGFNRQVIESANSTVQDYLQADSHSNRGQTPVDRAKYRKRSRFHFHPSTVLCEESVFFRSSFSLFLSGTVDRVAITTDQSIQIGRAVCRERVCRSV